MAMRWSAKLVLCTAVFFSISALALLDDQEYEYETATGERELEIEVDSDEVEIKAKVEVSNETADTKREDTLEWQIETRNAVGPRGGMEFKFSYNVESETGNTETEAELSYRVRVNKIIEFANSSTYAPNTSVVVQEYTMNLWGPFTRTVVGDIQEFQATTIDGVVSVIARISPKSVLASDATTLSPDAVKIDIKVENFPYQQSDSKLCMVGKLKSKMETDIDIDDDRRLLAAARRLSDDSDEDDIEIENPQLVAQLQADAAASIPVGRFDWKTTIKGDDKHYAVKTLQEQIAEAGDDDEVGETNHMLYWTFDTSIEVAAPANGGCGAFCVGTNAPTTAAPTTAAPTTAAPTTAAPTTVAPTTAAPTTAAPTNDTDSGNSSRRLDGRELTDVVQPTVFIWDPTIGLAYKKQTTSSPSQTSHAHPGAKYILNTAAWAMPGLVVALM